MIYYSVKYDILLYKVLSLSSRKHIVEAGKYYPLFMGKPIADVAKKT